MLKETDGDETEEDPGEALIRQLREYKAFKEAAKTMRELAHEAYGMRTKPPEEFPLPPKEIILRDTTVERLFAAMLSVLGRCGRRSKESMFTPFKRTSSRFAAVPAGFAAYCGAKTEKQHSDD